MGESVNGKKIRFIIDNNKVGEVDDRVFGQFLEKASFGEPGCENAVDKSSGNLRPEVEEFIKDMEVPIIRFPGGTDVDYTDWRDMVDNVPGRGEKRPFITETGRGSITNFFGYDEFLRFSERLKIETMLVVNFREAIAKEKPLKEAALNAAGLVAYCNAKVGDCLPEGMPDWPSIRVKNGHPEPYNVPYFQIGNENWAFIEKAIEKSGIVGAKEQAKWYIECINTYIDTIKSVDPTVKIIADGNIAGLTDLILNDKDFGNNIDYINYHSYTPWGINEIFKDGSKVPTESLTDEDVWYAWVAVPSFNHEGKSQFSSDWLNQLKKYNEEGRNWQYTMNEWNWNGWPGRGVKLALDNSRLAKGIGVAGYLNAFMRAGNLIKIATQSNLIGSTWDIGAVRVKPESNDPPYLNPAGQATTFYGKYHGNSLLKLEEENVPVYRQPYEMGTYYIAVDAIRPAEKVAMIDAVATGNNDVIYLHAINRNFSDPYTITIDVSRFGNINGRAVHHILQGRLHNEPKDGEPIQIAKVIDKDAGMVRDGEITITLPERSVSIIEIFR